MSVVNFRQLGIVSAIIAGFGLVISTTANALPSDANQPIRLLADKATYSEKSGVTSYAGNVTITQGTLNGGR